VLLKDALKHIPNATSMPGLCCSYECFSGLHYVVLLWFKICDCLCMPLFLLLLLLQIKTQLMIHLCSLL
jgi:hypothetical protein